MEIAIFIILMVLIVLVAILLLKGNKQPEDVSSKIDASLKEQFLAFQSNIHNELSSTRQEVSQSKDLLNQSNIKTLENFKKMDQTIRDIVEQQKEWQTLGHSLKDILKPPKQRGSYAEAILENLLEQALPSNLWVKQYSIDGLERVDAVLKLKDVVVPIDAKFPRDDYQRYMEADSPEDKQRCWDEFQNSLKIQVKSINKKYIKPQKGTTDFALMFIPSESIYYEIVADKNFLGQDSNIKDFLSNNRVVPVSPNTLNTHLHVIVLGFQNVEILKSAQQLQKGLSGIRRDFELFYKKYEDIGKNLEKASDSYRLGEGHIDKYKRKLDSTLALDGLNEEKEPLPEITQN